MVKRKTMLSVISLFAIAILLTFAYTIDAATNDTTGNSGTDMITKDVSAANNVYNRTYPLGISDQLKNSTGKVRVSADAADGIGYVYKNISVEVNGIKGWESLNSSEYTSRKNNYTTYEYDISVLRGSEPQVIKKKVNVTPILDRIGHQEAQFPDVQYVTLDGLDDARVIEYYGYGDCWADACWLYDKLSAEGIPVRIMGYEDGGFGAGWRHTWIEINVGNGWETWDYNKYDSQHAGDNGYGTPFVLIEPGHAPADILSTSY